MSDETIEPKTNDVEQVSMDKIRELVKAAGTNAAALEFPTDKWGFTSGIKREVLKAASTIRGQDDKLMLVTGVLAILMQHIKVRHASDKAVQEGRKARYAEAAEERAPRERVGAAVVGK